MTRPALPDAITEQRIIAIARRLSLEQTDLLTGVLLGSGIGVLEVTLDADDAVSTIAALDGSGLLVGADKEHGAFAYPGGRPRRVNAAS